VRICHFAEVNALGALFAHRNSSISFTRARGDTKFSQFAFELEIKS
jgi:hypothetical protein